VIPSNDKTMISSGFFIWKVPSLCDFEKMYILENAIGTNQRWGSMTIHQVPTMEKFAADT